MVGLIWEKKIVFRSKRGILIWVSIKLSFRSDHKYTTNTGDKQIKTYHRLWPDMPSEETVQVKVLAEKNLPSSHQHSHDCFSHPQHPVVKYCTTSFIK